MLQAGLCFTDDFLFLNVAPVIRQRMDGSQSGEKIGELLRLHCLCWHFTTVGRIARLVFTKLSADIQRLMGFITVYSNCHGSLMGRCYGNRFVARVGDNRDTRLHFVR